MNNFTKGLLVGVGVGLLIAPLSGQETRRLLAERAREWRESLPEDSRMNRYATQISDRVTSTKENWREYARQAASKARDKGSTLSNKALQSSQGMAMRARQTGMDMASRAKQSGQDMAHKAKQAGQDMAHKARQTAGRSSSPNGASSTRVMPELDPDA
ncbi:MAG TPA: YtxH domain-containing protein [Ktedonobacteraceae bacterium]